MSRSPVDSPKLVDLYCGLGGWSRAFLDAGYKVLGFDVERHRYMTEEGDVQSFPGQLVLQDVSTLHGAQLRDADVIVASPPCQEPSSRAMPWNYGKRIASGRRIPLIVENVRGAERWVGPARWHFGSYYLWGDVPPLMPIPRKLEGFKVPGQSSWTHFSRTGVVSPHWTMQRDSGVKQRGSGAAWFDSGICKFPSKSPRRKAASARIAMIPPVLAAHIAEIFKP